MTPSYAVYLVGLWMRRIFVGPVIFLGRLIQAIAEIVSNPTGKTDEESLADLRELRDDPQFGRFIDNHTADVAEQTHDGRLARRVVLEATERAQPELQIVRHNYIS